MNQTELFHEDIYSALRTDVSAVGGMKKVGCMLWPALQPHKAQEKLAQCLNRERAEKLDLEQVLFIKAQAKKVGSFAAVFFECDEVGMSRPTPIEPEDEYAKLQRQFIESQKGMQQIAERMEHLHSFYGNAKRG